MSCAYSGRNVLSVYKEETLATHQHTALACSIGCQRDDIEDNDVIRQKERKNARLRNFIMPRLPTRLRTSVRRP